MNPPFPHKKSDTPVERLVSRALEGLRERGKLAVILPMSLLVKKDKASWRKQVLAKHTLLAACQLPDELFQPFASATTAFVVIEKGVPHNPKRKTTFVRLHYDGLSLHKSARIERGPNQITDALHAILNKSPRLRGSLERHILRKENGSGRREPTSRQLLRMTKSLTAPWMFCCVGLHLFISGTPRRF